MNCEKKIFSNFYFKTFFIGWSLCCSIWSFMIFQFWWGNHDWDHLKRGVSLAAGFFEARYSLHLPSVLFFDGQLLPVFTLCCTNCFLVIMAILTAKYLQIPKTIFSYLFFVLVVVSLPHIAILFYFVHYMLALAFWGCVGIGLLFLFEDDHKWWKFVSGTIGFVLLLGSYPPIFSLLITVFVGKKILDYLKNLYGFRKLVNEGLFFCGQLVSAFLVYKVILAYLVSVNMVNTGMYNLSTYTVWEVLRHVPIELWASFTFLRDLQRFFGNMYLLFFAILFSVGLGIIIFKAKNKIIAIALIITLLLASRLSFLLAGASYIAYFRVCLWGELGLFFVFLAFLLRENTKVVRNFLFVCGIIFCSCFLRTDFEIQKVQWLGFYSERLFHKRVDEKLFSYPKFDLNNHYMVLNFGYPKLHHHFCYDGCKGFNNDVLDNTVLEAYFGDVIFWDEVAKPRITKLGAWGGLMYFVGETPSNMSIYADNVADLRYWAYVNARRYPAETGIYVDDQFLFFMFDKMFFDTNREMVLDQLKLRQK